MKVPFPRWLRRVLIVLALPLLLLGLVELSLRAVPAALLWSRRLPERPVSSGDTVILVLGDSVPFGYGVAAEHSWPAQLVAALQARGRTGLHVRNQATPGARSDTLLATLSSALDALPADASARVLVQVGHNDYTFYGGFRRTPQSERVPIPHVMPWWWDLRVARVARWWGEALDQARWPESLDEDVQTRFIANLGQVVEQARSHDAEVLLLTYLVPGEAGAGLSPQEAIMINDLRRIQLEVNRLLRRAAVELDVPLLDLAWTIPGLPTYDPAWFLDGVHTTAGTNRAIADAVADRL